MRHRGDCRAYSPGRAPGWGQWPGLSARAQPPAHVHPRRRTAVAALLWASAAILTLLPIAEHEYTYRYVLPAVPLACIAAAIALRKPGREAAQPEGAAPARPTRAGFGQPPKCGSPVYSVIVLPFGAWFFGL